MNNAQILELDKANVLGTYARQPIALVRGQGILVWDADGREYLDFVQGLAANVLGHCHPKVVDAVREQAGRLIHCTNLYGIKPQAELAALLAAHSFADKVFFCNSGTEANEAAIKLARKWAKANRHPEAHVMITARKSFHGRTLAALAATGQPRYHEGFEPMPAGFVHVPFNDLEAVEREIDGQTAAIMVEPVQGESGVNPARPEYLRGLREICDRHGLLLILDEVQTGLGRTGKLWAHENYGIQPDVMTLAKGLGGGVPIGAMLVSARSAGAFKPGNHGTTFGGNPLAAAAALATLKTVIEEGLAARADSMGEYLRTRLSGLVDRYPSYFKEIRGMGLMVGAELTFPGQAVVDLCRESGLILNCTETFVLRFLPPLNVKVEEIDRAVDILAAALGRVEPAEAK